MLTRYWRPELVTVLVEVLVAAASPIGLIAVAGPLLATLERSLAEGLGAAARRGRADA